MEIKMLLAMEVGVENLTLDCVKIEAIYEPNKGTGTNKKTGKSIPWTKQGFKVSDLSGELILSSFDFVLDANLKGTHVKLTGINISLYKEKKQFTCKSWEGIGSEPNQEPINKHEEPEKAGLKEVLSKTEVKPVDWDSKERRIIKQNALSHATAAVIAKHDRFNTVADMVEQIKISAKEFELWVYSDNSEDAPF